MPDLTRVLGVVLAAACCLGALPGTTRHNGKQDASTVYWTVDEDGGGDGEAGTAGTLSGTQSPLYPPIVNVAPHGRITANATCGERGEERWCKGAAGGGRGGGGGGGRRQQQCFYCHRHHPDKAHPPELALDAGSDGWWQSPTLAEGPEYEHVTVTLDLQQVYHVSYVILKTGPSPRPAAWVLERSVDAEGDSFSAWQYFAVSDEDCWSRYGIAATPGDPAKAALDRDDQVICTSFHSKAYPAEDAAVHTWLVKGRPNSSEALQSFQAARWVRLRFQRLTPSDPRRAFYSIKFLSIGAQCVCNGHASRCTGQSAEPTGPRSACKCQHNTEGPACERCRPRFNQQPWQQGRPCEECECHGHARSCRYDPEVARAQLSRDKVGELRGGGVCLNCTDHTAGVNCERCAEGWFRPSGVAPDDPTPCAPCECHPAGSYGACAPDSKAPGVEAGECVCRDGFAGHHCDRCAPGYRHFPLCQPCPCDPRGSEHAAECDGECFCKANVEGARCDRCRPGYFGLVQWDAGGCAPCYCSGVTSECTEAALAVSELGQRGAALAGWRVADLRVSEVVTPAVDQDTGLLTVADTDLDVDSYFWLAPRDFTGNLLTSYGAELRFNTAWVVMRGDTSGKATAGPDLILIGSNGMRVAYGESVHSGPNASVSVPLREGAWFLLQDGVGDISTRLRRTGGHYSDEPSSPYRGALAGRNQLLSVLADLQHLLVRAKYHTDQVEGSLEGVVLQRGLPGVAVLEPLSQVEQCSCPDGYLGLSCESCAWGFARVSPAASSSNATTGLASGHRGLCVRCNCNGHAADCDPDTNKCGACEHHTAGERCERCAPGYFGDALRGLAGDCRPCACPLLLLSNNFSPACELQLPGDASDNDVVEDYICTACPAGHAGKHCERCAEGYFGDPTSPGDKCSPCQCAGGPCDVSTGRCLSCPGNTDGWRCEKCKPGHYGKPEEGHCLPCECSEVGSEATGTCDQTTGQCPCKARYTARTCDRCEEGRGNVSAGCVPCSCGSAGSVSDTCDAVTGECSCRQGYSPPDCRGCLLHHYNDPDTGCAGCGCSAAGSVHAACDIVTGRCECKSNVVGRTCDTCKHGFWGLDSGEGCSPCLCDTLGAYNDSCSAVTGQCPCRPGIGGLQCDSCLPGYVGFSPDGCRECDPCDKPGHVCDPDTGHCVCPPLTLGAECEVCELNSWGFRSGRGCKPCACDPVGSFQTQCEAGSGQCQCRRGFAGARCDQCAPGFFGYPSCRSCRCDPRGAEPASCNATDGRCSCDAAGQCSCKVNAAGPRCDTCREGTFGLRAGDPDGCQACFCFGRSTQCTEEGLTWGRLTQLRPRALLVQYESQNPQFRPGAQLLPVNTQEICYINLALPGSVGKSVNTTDRLDVTNNLRVIPGDAGDVEMGVNYLFDTPIYWQLPRQFLGDRVLSFGGFLRFNVETEGGSTLFPPEVLDSYPLIQLQGNNRIVLEHFPGKASKDGHYEVRLHHSLWRAKNNSTSKVSREMLMLALQNLQHIFIRATDSVDFTKAMLRGISLDTAQSIPGDRGPPARGVELCECPTQYTASSCQDPSIGFFRWHDRSSVHSTIVIQMIGEARPCQCQGRSQVCDVETGHCKNCTANTGGPSCERCAEGHYGHPDEFAGCRACPCPSEHRNFAYRCEVPAAGAAECYCKDGYEGPRCDRCAPGWYGQPHLPGGACRPCDCDPLGSVNDECDQRGQCECLPGIAGPRCSVCPARQVLTARASCTTCDDGCTGELLRGLEKLAAHMQQRAGQVADGVLEAPWAVLEDIEDRAQLARARLEDWRKLADEANGVPSSLAASLRKPANQAVKEAKKLEHASVEAGLVAMGLYEAAETTRDQLELTRKQIEDTVTSLRSSTLGGHTPLSMSSALADAQYKLDYIVAGMAYLEPRATQTYNNFRRCDETYDDLLKLLDFGDVQRLSGLRRRVLRLQDGLRDLNETLSNSASNASHVEQRFNNKNKRKLKDLVSRSAWLSAEEAALSAMVTSNADILNEAERASRAAQSNLRGVRAQQSRLRNLTGTLEQRMRAESRPDLSHYLILARDRANMLRHTADMYERLFSGTKRDAELALQASAAYRNIAEALHGAWDAANNASLAADLAYRRAYPKHLDSLLSQSGLALSDSQRLQGSAHEQARRVSRLRLHLQQHEGVVDTLSETLILAGRHNNENQRPLQQLEQQLQAERAAAQRVLEDTRAEVRAAQAGKRTAAEVLTNVTSQLRPLLATMESEGETGLAATEHQVKELRSLIARANDTLLTADEAGAEQQREFQRWNDSFADKLEALRNKIQRARHVADGIRLSVMSSKESGGCSRSYSLPQLGPSTTTSISLYYAVTGRARSATIFYLPSSTSADFIALEMVDRRIRLSWDVGGGPGFVTSPVVLQGPGHQEVWYLVEAERTGNIGHLAVVEAERPDGAPPPKVVFNSTAAGFGRLDLGDPSGAAAVAWVGGLPPGVEARGGTTATAGLGGCMHSLKLDGRPIGLWNFRTSSDGCSACKQGVEQEHDDQTYNFRGDGYSELRHSSSSPYNKYFFSVSLNFRTFDENALLFLAVKDDRRRYVALSLHQGRVNFRVGYAGDDAYLEISTVAKYNTGNWTRVEASRYFDRSRGLEKGLLKVDSEARNGSPPTFLKADALPDLAGALYYIGGVPPGFEAVGPFSKPVSFLGCMSLIQVAQEGYNPLRGQFYGVDPSCSGKPLRAVSFGGNGFLELASHSLRKKSSFGFVFATSQPDTMLMITTFQRPGSTSGAEVEEENTNIIEIGDDNSYYSCALWNGRLEVRVDAGRGTVSLQSLEPLNDGQLHSLSLSKLGRRLELRVDDILQATATLPEGAAAVRALGDLGGLYFGGVPAALNVTDMIATTMPLTGTIKDAIFNDELLAMDRPVSFESAAIGRLGPVGGVLGASPQSTSPHSASPPPPPAAPTTLSLPPAAPAPPPGPPPATQEASACQKMSSYSFEAEAVKFGDSPNSHVHVSIRRKSLLQRDFTVELHFRTFYPSGMLYLVPGGRARQRQYLVAYLLDGILQVVYKGRNKLEVSLPNTYNDGAWHVVRLKKEGRTLSLSVDADPPERRKGPKKMNIGSSVYIGGLPENTLLVPDNFVQRLEPFRGCMRRLSINALSQDLVGENAAHHRVGQCFSSVEPGSYFAGDAYALYKNKFVVGDLLHVEVEFRTSELSGVLLSLSEPKGYPAMSLELNGGRVVWSGDIGDRRRFEVAVSPASPWTLCDNRWHRIRASFEHGEVVLQVDELRGSQALADDGHLLEHRTTSPVYIGGLAEGAASETLGVRDNFKGCIRKVMVGGERRDWTVMADLHNIGLGSCPTFTN